MDTRGQCSVRLIVKALKVHPGNIARDKGCGTKVGGWDSWQSSGSVLEVFHSANDVSKMGNAQGCLMQGDLLATDLALGQ